MNKKPSRVAQLAEQHRRATSPNRNSAEQSLIKARLASERELARIKSELDKDALDMRRSRRLSDGLKMGGNLPAAQHILQSMAPVRKRFLANLKMYNALKAVKSHDETIQHAVRTQQTVRTMTEHARLSTSVATSAIDKNDDLYDVLGEAVSELTDAASALTSESLPADLDPQIMYADYSNGSNGDDFNDEDAAMIEGYMQMTGVYSAPRPVAAQAPAQAPFEEFMLPAPPQHPVQVSITNNNTNSQFSVASSEARKRESSDIIARIMSI